MKTALDTSVLLLIQKHEPGWERWRDAINRAAMEGTLLISPVAFAEYSLGYPSAQTALARLEAIQIYYDDIKPETCYLAGKIFLKYRKEGGPREHLIPDFLIGAHACLQADRLAAIDRGYLRRYFPELPLLQTRGT